MDDWKHQTTAIKRFSPARFFGLLFDCGTGKTRTAIKIALEKQKPVLVIAPKNLCTQWRDAIKDIAGENEAVLVVRAADVKKKKFAKALDSFLD